MENGSIWKRSSVSKVEGAIMKMRLDSIILSFSRFVGLTTSVLYHMTMDKIDEALELTHKKDFL